MYIFYFFKINFKLFKFRTLYNLKLLEGEMLKKQHFELLKLIENEKKLSKIAELLNLTERSVRYKIDEINEELGIKKLR